MTFEISFNPPQFGEEYDGAKMRVLAEEIERLHAQLTASFNDQGEEFVVVTFPSADATPSVEIGTIFKTTGTTTITDFIDGSLGQTIRILATAAITITDNAAIILSAGANYAMTDSDTLTLTMFDTGVWSEVARSVN